MSFKSLGYKWLSYSNTIKVNKVIQTFQISTTAKPHLRDLLRLQIKAFRCNWPLILEDKIIVGFLFVVVSICSWSSYGNPIFLLLIHHFTPYVFKDSNNRCFDVLKVSNVHSTSTHILLVWANQPNIEHVVLQEYLLSHTYTIAQHF